jgi:hypothetical protein
MLNLRNLSPRPLKTRSCQLLDQKTRARPELATKNRGLLRLTGQRRNLRRRRCRSQFTTGCTSLTNSLLLKRLVKMSKIKKKFKSSAKSLRRTKIPKTTQGASWLTTKLEWKPSKSKSSRTWTSRKCALSDSTPRVSSWSRTWILWISSTFKKLKRRFISQSQSKFKAWDLSTENKSMSVQTTLSSRFDWRQASTSCLRNVTTRLKLMAVWQLSARSLQLLTLETAD